MREDVRAHAATSTAGTRPRGTRRAYSERALNSHQPRVTDLIPRRVRVFVLLWGLGLIVPLLITGIFYTHRYWSPWWGIEGPRTFDLLIKGTVARWWTSLTFMLIAGVAALIFHMRRFKLDDYRARYRLWVWTAIVAAMASLDVATDMHLVAGRVVMKLTHRNLAEVPKSIWMSGWMLLAGVVLFRSAWDMVRSRVSLALLVLSVGSFGAAGLAHVGRWRVNDPLLHVMTVYALWQLGQSLLLFSFLVYARYVYLSAQGLSGGQKSAKSVRKKAESEDKGTDSSEDASGLDQDSDDETETSGRSTTGGTNSYGQYDSRSSGNTSRDDRRQQHRDVKKQQRRAA